MNNNLIFSVNASEYPEVTELWECSVRATHASRAGVSIPSKRPIHF
ncbi:hypothetical protein LPW36_15360 [Jinshanibacter sp. LJY008]|uniref:Uncharacterized protein n=1 Tax=Limnobaculum eriocheiris TaxID=2897391 RepID=A0A9X1SMK1_9GAMM|nr:hypothetical protein [Limnobaculum eriocheiris]MCD1127354.1 hypothetical protein [Limnobaculum eriocheiris]